MEKLFCIPFAGGSHFYFECLKEKFNGILEVELLDYAGHGSRFNENLLLNFEDMIKDIYNQILIRKKDPCDSICLFGYSMGALIAYEIAKNYEDLNISLVIIAAFQPPNYLREYLHMDNKKISWKIFNEKYTSSQFRNIKDERFLNIYTRILRNDFNCLYDYAMINVDFGKIKGNIVALCGIEDSLSVHFEDWGNFTTGSFKSYYFKGKHFFLGEHLNKICSIIMDAVAISI